MGSADRRQREIEEIKKKIIDAATELFIHEGYAHVSIRKIAQKIEYSPTTIYNYFRDKEEILHHLLKQGYALFYQYLDTAVQEEADTGSDSVHQLRSALRAYTRFGLEHADYYKLIFIEDLERRQPFEDCETDRHRGFALLARLVEQAIAEKGSGHIDLQQTSQLLWAAVHGITSLLVTFDDFPWVDDREELIESLIETQIRGLFASV
ncbi:TetR/AcrR family transcriptional regulator [Brevibacillus humidisoli]|uniref:TetR/AcrR family transcriptional regulator n=1 Tax=Brevibacillus humidisoli TaxID=2895522 RepID=UPI001E604479|nr:TetR/AcrR family transcriptional regulator [Brevibacillus humidisoli]UFJ41271.1 TetR/AcrR family transcriptional regulator [Brevibacillus humidisoli]